MGDIISSNKHLVRRLEIVLFGVEYVIPSVGAAARLSVKTEDIMIMLEDVASWLMGVKFELLAVTIAVRFDSAKKEVIIVMIDNIFLFYLFI